MLQQLRTENIYTLYSLVAILYIHFYCFSVLKQHADGQRREEVLVRDKLNLHILIVFPASLARVCVKIPYGIYTQLTLEGINIK